MQYEEDSGEPYRPFKFPPDYALARLHQRASMPGNDDPLELSCPCCNVKLKTPFIRWWGRSLVKDFKRYGGAVVCYFRLMRLYIIAMLAVLVLYGVYLQYLDWNYCQQLEDETLKNQVCSKLFGVWVITNEDLYKLIDRAGDRDVLVRFSVIRAFVFLLLLLVNALSLYLIRNYKSRYPDKPDASQFSLLFKNIQDKDIVKLLAQLRSECGSFEIRETLMMKQTEPFYSAYNQKIRLYYECLRETNQKKIPKLKKKLFQFHQLCEQHKDQVQKDVGRVIIVFESVEVRDRVLKKYGISWFRQTAMLLSGEESPKNRFYCQECPQAEQIIWKNIGTDDRSEIQLKIQAFVYYIGILGLAVLILLGLSRIIYFDKSSGIFKAVVQNIVLFIVAFIAIGFRMLMDKLADMRNPVTVTSRTMSIVITTVMLHFIFYLWMPSIYLSIYKQDRGSVLNLMSNQAITTVVVQIILTSMDLFYCSWNSRKTKIEDEDRPFACQKLLHQAVQYPRFPFEFKMIVLYKFWSLITFFAFQIPMVLALIVIALIFHFIKDKYNLYFHYRSEIIKTRVQFNFLKIYTNLFTIYIYIVYVYTQHTWIETTSGGIVTIIFLLIQIIYFRKEKIVNPDEDEKEIKLLNEIEEATLYKEKYERFLQTMTNQAIDIEIYRFLERESLIQSVTKLN